MESSHLLCVRMTPRRLRIRRISTRRRASRKPRSWRRSSSKCSPQHHTRMTRTSHITIIFHLMSVLSAARRIHGTRNDKCNHQFLYSEQPKNSDREHRGKAECVRIHRPRSRKSWASGAGFSARVSLGIGGRPNSLCRGQHHERRHHACR